MIRVYKLILTSLFVLLLANVLMPTSVYATDSPLLARSTIRNVRNGWHHTGGHYFFYVNGTREQGWIRCGRNWYFMNPRAGLSGHTNNLPVGAMRERWVQYHNNWYFLNPGSGRGRHATLPQGAMRTGWVEIGANTWFFLNTTTRRGITGSMEDGWIRVGSNWFFLNPRAGVAGHNSALAHGVMFHSGRFVIDNAPHQFAANGVWQNQISGDNITNIRLSVSEWILTTNETFTPGVTTTPANQQEELRWTSSNNNVATVNNLTGEIRGVNNGTATIEATAPPGRRARMTIIVDNVWNCNDEFGRVFFWDLRTLQIYQHVRNGILNSSFNNHMTNAQRQWSTAIGGMEFIQSTYENAHILSYGGNRREMYALANRYGISIRGWAGVARFPTITYVGTINVSGTRRVYRMEPNSGIQTRAVMLNATNFPAPNESLNFSEDEFRSIVLHELGHLMGYVAHSNNRNDVMFYQIMSSNTVLSPSEQRHLRRIYDRFRN